MAGYIGGTFSLISSTARVRYTGILAEVNQTDGSIILNNGAFIYSFVVENSWPGSRENERIVSKEKEEYTNTTTTNKSSQSCCSFSFSTLSLFALTRISFSLFTMLHTKNSVESRHGKPKKFGETGDSALSGGPHGDSFSPKRNRRYCSDSRNGEIYNQTRRPGWFESISTGGIPTATTTATAVSTTAIRWLGTTSPATTNATTTVSATRISTTATTTTRIRTGTASSTAAAASWIGTATGATRSCSGAVSAGAGKSHGSGETGIRETDEFRCCRASWFANIEIKATATR